MTGKVTNPPGTTPGANVRRTESGSTTPKASPNATPTGTTKPAWSAKTGGTATPKRDGFEPSTPRGAALTNLTPVTVTAPTLSPLGPAGAAPINPLDALKLVKNGTLDLQIPLPTQVVKDAAGKWISVKPNTTVKVSATVTNGVLDLKNAKADIQPPLDGPLWTSVKGVKFDDQGRLTMDITGAPDVKVGPPLNSNLTQLATQLEGMSKLPVDAWGIHLANIDLSGTHAQTDPKTTKPSANPMDLINGARISLKNVELNDGAVKLGGGSITFAKGSKLNLEGTLNSMKLSGHVGIDNLSIAQGGTRLNGGQGSTDLSVTLDRAPGKPMTMQTSLSNLNLKTDYAVTERENGDFIELAQGDIKNGSLQMSETIGNKTDPTALGTPSLQSLKLGQFDGTLKSARLTMTGDNGTSEQISVGPSTISGDVSIDPKQIAVHGKVDMQASVDNLSINKFGASVNVQHADLKGKGNLSFESGRGLDFSGGSVEVQAKLSGTQKGYGSSAEIADGSSVHMRADSISLGPKGFDAKGRGEVDLKLKNLDVGTGPMPMKASTASLTGAATVDLTDGQLNVASNNLKLDAALTDGEFKLGDGADLHFKAGTELHTGLTQLAYGPKGNGVTLKPGTQIGVELANGKIAIPGGPQVDLKGGSVKFKFDQFGYSDGGMPTAKGSMSLDASLNAGNVDLSTLKGIPGVQLDSLSGVEQHLQLGLGNFSITKDGTFDVSNITVGVQAQIHHFGGRVTR